MRRIYICTRYRKSLWDISIPGKGARTCPSWEIKVIDHVMVIKMYDNLVQGL